MVTVVEKSTSRDSTAVTKRYIGVFDVLGFKDRMRTDGLQKVADGYRNLMRQIQPAAETPVIGVGGNERWTTPLVVFSDTILMWSDDDPESLDSFLSSCSFLIAYAFNIGWYLRGGVAFGDSIMNRASSEFLGQPIIDAHLLEESQDWIGGAFHNSCSTANSYKVFRTCDNVVNYPVPLKPSAQMRANDVLPFVINWPVCAYVNRETTLTDLIAMHGPPHRAKYQNSLAFVEHVGR